MMTAALNFLSATWKYWAPALGAVFILHMAWYSPRMDNLELRIELNKKEVSRLENVIESQNTAIKNASEVSQSVFNDMLGRLETTLEEDRSETDDMLRRIIETGMPVGCNASTEYLIEQVNNLKWGTNE